LSPTPEGYSPTANDVQVICRPRDVTNSGRLTECRPTPDWSDDGIVLLVDHATLLEADGRLVLIARLTPSRRRAFAASDNVVMMVAASDPGYRLMPEKHNAMLALLPTCRRGYRSSGVRDDAVVNGPGRAVRSPLRERGLGREEAVAWLTPRVKAALHRL
jgi:hypothetical protein